MRLISAAVFVLAAALAVVACTTNSITNLGGKIGFTHLYVGNNTATPAPQLWQFALPLTNSSSATVTMPGNGMNDPRGIAFDRFGNMYVVNFGSGNTYITVFAPGVTAASSPVATITTGFGCCAEGIAIDPSGLIWVCSFSDSKCFQYPGPYIGNISPSPSITLSAGIISPSGLAFNAAGDLFVANSTLGGGIVRFNHPITNGQGNNGVLSTSGNTADGLAIDSAGNLYAGEGDGPAINRWNANNQGDGATPDFTDTAATATPGLSADAAGNLYAAAFGACQINVFPSVATTFSNTLAPTVMMPLPAGCIHAFAMGVGP